MRLTIISLTLILLTTCSSKDQHYINSEDGLPIYFEEKGNGEPAVVFIHGWSPTHECWNEQVSFLSPTYHVVALDLPGFGLSGNERKNWTIDRFGRDIVTLAEALDLNDVILVGHSMGGLVALSATTKIPSKVKSVVLVDILNDINNNLDDAQIEGLINSWKPMIRKGNLDSLNSFFLTSELTERFNGMLPDEIPSYWWEILRSTFQWMRDSSKLTIQQIKAPIYSINADQSTTNVEAMKQYAGNYNATIIRETSHYLFWDKPNEFDSLLLSIVKANSN